MIQPEVPPTRVVKVGGSLLQNPSLPHRLNQFLDAGQKFRHVVIAGGGHLVNGVRRWYETYALSEAACHWASIRLMRETAWLLTQVCPRLGWVDDWQALPVRGSCVLDCQTFMTDRSRLPANWDTTSDSMAAELAEQLGADELWLLKSSLPCSSSIADWQAAGYVDSQFAQTASGGCPVFALNLADPNLLWIQGD